MEATMTELRKEAPTVDNDADAKRIAASTAVSGDGVLTDTAGVEAKKDIRTIKRPIIAACIGNGIEWMDYAMYGYLAPVLGALFFPQSHDSTPDRVRDFRSRIRHPAVREPDLRADG
jgi:hypothetical protein